MLYWALVFFIVAIVAALFGFGGIAAGAEGIAKILFVVFLVLFLISLFTGWRGRTVVSRPAWPKSRVTSKRWWAIRGAAYQLFLFWARLLDDLSAGRRYRDDP